MSKNPFDRIVGPNGEWVDHEADSAGGGLSERDEFALRCLNSSVNLYGVVTAREFCEIYNNYAKNHDSPIARPMTEDEALSTAKRLQENIAETNEACVVDVLAEEAWFSLCHDDEADEWLFVYWSFTDELLDEVEKGNCDPNAIARAKGNVMRRIDETRSQFGEVPLKMLPEEDFLLYDDPNGDEETSDSRKLEKFLKNEYAVTKNEAEFDVMGIQAHLRVNGASLSKALEYISDHFDYEPADEDGLSRLMDALAPVVGTTRTWEYRGHTQHEMCKLGKIDKYTKEEIPDFFGIFGDDDDGDDDDGEADDDYYDDDYDVEGEPVCVEDLPPAKRTGRFDFKSVKDAAVREKLLWDYEGVRIVTREFVRRVVIREATETERIDAAKRLGFPVDKKTGRIADAKLDIVAGDFASMMDDQHGEPAIRRVLKRKDKLKDKLDRAAAEYYENYRYTWLEVLAVKAGVGVKCRDLLTGEELFLMEQSFSLGDVKGMTICAGIAPMGEVYLVLGVIHPTHFDNPAAILKIVLAHLGLPTELPVSLSFSDQARFAAETIRRVNANGKFDGIAYGGGEPAI